jgi:hypothetical protein
MLPDQDISIEERLWTNTWSGKRFTVFAPKVEDIVIEDIGQGLSHLCRFAGQCSKFYSVAEHSGLVTDAVARMGGSLIEQRWALLHDATEAYLVDVPRPVKVHPLMTFYRTTEGLLAEAIATRFDLPLKMPPIVKWADLQLLAYEADYLVPRKPADWALPEKEIMLAEVAKPQCLSPVNAKMDFYLRFTKLFNLPFPQGQF